MTPQPYREEGCQEEELKQRSSKDGNNKKRNCDNHNAATASDFDCDAE